MNTDSELAKLAAWEELLEGFLRLQPTPNHERESQSLWVRRAHVAACIEQVDKLVDIGRKQDGHQQRDRAGRNAAAENLALDRAWDVYRNAAVGRTEDVRWKDFAQAAELQGVSRSTTDRDWQRILDDIARNGGHIPDHRK